MTTTLPIYIYLVHIYDRNDVGTGMSVDIPVGQNYLDLDDEAVVLNGCDEQVFFVQAVIGSRVSENSSAVNGSFSVGEFSICNYSMMTFFVPYSPHVH